MNEFYTPAGNPAQGTSLTSANVRAEFLLLQAAFDKLPILFSNPSAILAVNAGGTAIAPATSIENLPIGATTPRSAVFTTLSVTGSSTLGSTTSTTVNIGAGGIVKNASGNTQIGGALNVVGRLGVGTASPTASVDIVSTGVATAKISPSVGTNGAVWQYTNTGGDFYVGRDNSVAGLFGGISAYAAAVWNSGAQPVIFGTSNAYRGQFSATGGFAVNTSGFSGSNLDGFTVEPYIGGVMAYFGHNGSAAGGDTILGFLRNGATIGSITQVSSSGVAYNVTSDERLKKNIVEVGDVGEIVDAIRVVSHDWISDGSHTPFGVIAQELHAVVPHVVLEGDNDLEVTRPWQVDYSKLVPVLVKELQSLRARVAILESV